MPETTPTSTPPSESQPTQLGLPMPPQDALKVLEEATSNLNTTRDNHFKIFNALVTFRNIIVQREELLKQQRPAATESSKKD